ncbi:leucine-rich repeat-containing 15-like [Brachionus plicatilis]|uniref:Leucine-rich repeat-containing 15-like n=1 Tax=Brachionus plicatilis TaxID=10195 RepID=A0A3M7SG21_BRAPC|nr:leucine-rich repeat-containing 15-like [Brachionus plicatilis]
MNDIFSESTNVLITKAYLPDLDRPAPVQIFDKTCTSTHIRNTDKKMAKQKFEIMSTSLPECNARINRLLSKSLNTYKLRSEKDPILDINHLQNFIQSPDDYLMQNSTSQQMHELYVSFVDYLNQPRIEFKSSEPIFTLTSQAITDLNKVGDFDSAFRFFDTYGYSYPLTSYETNQYNIAIIRVCSYFVSDPLVLESKVRSFFSSYKRKSDKNVIYRSDTELQMLRFEIVLIETPQLFKCNDQIKWTPLPKLISTSTNTNLIQNKSAINYLTDCWLIRDTNHLLINRIFTSPTLVTQLEENKNFNFNQYWFDSFSQKIYLKYEKFLTENFYSKSEFPFDYRDARVIGFLSKLAQRADYETRILELVSASEFMILAGDLECSPNSMLLYYTKEWIENDPDTYLALLASVKLITSMFQFKPICVLVDYEFYGFERELGTFYLEYKLIEYPDVKIERVRDKMVIDAKNQGRIDFENLMDFVLADKTVLKFKNNLALVINYFSFPQLVREKIVEIDLSKNCLISIELDSFGGMLNLKKLNLSQNSLSNVKPIFKKLKNLQYLNLSMNKIGHIDEQVFSDLENLLCLNLSNNYLRKVPNICALVKLTELNLGNNRLKSIGKELDELKNLKTLFLCFNSIEVLNCYSLINLRKIEFLFLNSNNLKKIDPKMFLHMDKLKILFLCANECIVKEDIEKLRFSSEYSERIMFVYRNEQYGNFIKCFDKMYKYFGFDVQALRMVYDDNISGSVSSSDCYEFNNFSSRL